MTLNMKRRQFLQLAGLGGVVASTGLYKQAFAARPKSQEEFYFIQLSDTHWGFNKKKFNPDPQASLRQAFAMVNQLEDKPDFIMFTGDLTHTTDDPKQRRQRLSDFRGFADQHLEHHTLRFIPGEHDASLDNGEAYRELFGETYYSFDHKGIHFIALDNVSDPRGRIGDTQLQWLATDLAQLSNEQAIVVFAHRPLFPLYPKWDWHTADGERAITLLKHYSFVEVFYGHIHQRHHHQTAHISHHAASSLVFPLPKPGAAPKRKPLVWDANSPHRGLAVREIESYGHQHELKEHDLS